MPRPTCIRPVASPFRAGRIGETTTKRVGFAARLGLGFGLSLGFCLHFLRAAAGPATDVRKTTVSALPTEVGLESVPEHGLQPQVQVDERGCAHLLYLRHEGDAAHADVRYSKREPGQASWTEPLTVNAVPGSALAIGTIRGPQLALGAAGDVHICWNGSDRARPKPAQGGAPLLYTHLNATRTAFAPERDLLGQTRSLDGGAALAADSLGHVWVFWHAAAPDGPGGETNRAVYLAASDDHGRQFNPERRVSPPNSGACACCGLQARAVAGGPLLVWYRAAPSMDRRPGTLLLSSDLGRSFAAVLQDDWAVNQCPMSSASLASGLTESPAPAGTSTSTSLSASTFFAAWETAGRIQWIRSTPVRPGAAPAFPASAVRSISSGNAAKHPTLAVNRRGEALLAWTEGTGWQRGGSLAWQVVGPDGAVKSQGRTEGVPVWGSLAAYVDVDDAFRLLH